MYNLKKYQPVNTNDLVRVGRKRDGGYVINNRVINLTKMLVGLGVSIDWSFEEDFKNRNRQIKIYAFDYSVSFKIFLKKAQESFSEIFKVKPADPTKSTGAVKRVLYPFLYLKTAFTFKKFFSNNKNNFFFKNGISKTNEGLFITVDEMFSKIFKQETAKPNSVFLKIDIEGSEYDVLPLVAPYTSYINTMAIEFHMLQKNWTAFEKIMDELMQDYSVVHIHANNFAGYIAGTHTPDCIELTITKKALLNADEQAAAQSNIYPIKGLDYPCSLKREDLTIEFN